MHTPEPNYKEAFQTALAAAAGMVAIGSTFIKGAPLLLSHSDTAAQLFEAFMHTR